MENKFNENLITFYEKYDDSGILQSVIKYKIQEEEKEGYYFIPKWAIVLAGVFYVFVFIMLLTAIFVVYMAPRPGLYQESCLGRSCIKNFGLVCLNSKCSCSTGYLYIDKCVFKKTYAEQCNGNNYCQDNTSLVCLNGACSCNSSQYWNNEACTNFVSYGKSCKTDSQCDPSLKLICDTIHGSCACQSSR